MTDPYGQPITAAYVSWGGAEPAISSGNDDPAEDGHAMVLMSFISGDAIHHLSMRLDHVREMIRDVQQVENLLKS